MFVFRERGKENKEIEYWSLNTLSSTMNFEIFKILLPSFTEDEQFPYSSKKLPTKFLIFYNFISFRYWSCVQFQFLLVTLIFDISITHFCFCLSSDGTVLISTCITLLLNTENGIPEKCICKF